MAASTAKPKARNANAAAVRDLLLWARANRFFVHGVTVGDVTITCQDTAPLPAVAPKGKPAPLMGRPQAPAPTNVYEDFGGDAWKAAVAASAAPGDGEDDDEEDPDGDDDIPPP